MLKRALTYFGVIFAIFTRDVKRVLRNPVALVITLGMIAMPSAYAWYVIVANWDPYSNTEHMMVAVANNDEGADSPEAGHLDVGAEVVDQLHDNHDMGWEFTDEQSAVQGVYEGKYWAALVIPKDFSADFASVFTGDFTQPTLDYYVNEKPSSIAPKVTDAAANAVEKAVNESFVKTVTEKVVDTTQDAGATTENKAHNAEGSLTAGVRSAHETVAQTRTALDGLANTVQKTRTAVKNADDTLTGLQESLPHLRNAIAQSKTLLEQTRDTASSYGTSLSKHVTDGALALAGAASTTQKALGTVSGDVASAEASAQAALFQAQALVTDNETLIAELSQQAAQEGANPAIGQALNDARNANDRLKATVSALSQAEQNLASTTSALETEGTALTDAAESGASTAQKTAAAFQDSVLPNITKSLDALVEACGTLDGALAGLTPSLGEARAILAELDDTLSTASDSLSSTSASLGTMEENLNRTLTDLEALQSSATAEALAQYLKADPATVGSFMAAPVALDTQLVYPVKNYGSGVAPFFTNLALWVAGFILMAMVKLRVDPAGLPKFTPTQAYFGRWLFYVVAGLAMGLVCCAGDLVLGIQCENPAAFIGAGLLTVFVDVNLMFALAYAFRHLGKALSVILLIVQIPGSSGMFPIEMMPAFFRAIHPLLPFTYSIDAMREAIGGFYGMDYLHDMLLLGLLFVPLGFLIGLGIGRYDFNLNLMFDEKLGATDLFTAEPVTTSASETRPAPAPSQARFRTRTLVQALLDTKAFRSELLERAARFKKRYPRLLTAGWAALILQPLVTFAVMVVVKADVDARVMMLMAMVAGIIVVNVYLIVISFLNDRLTHQLALANMSAADLQAMASRQAGIAAPKPPRDSGGDTA
ncbi:YhgE/Pip domain-containing protein [Adlercreutzia sp. R25]|uniref:YhgE/Pip domain-containing protein n=1 Tax=Adlercreutzia shanghongiae TaxID=3111773 RepID=UPI002DB6D3AA|nr:YhgE/Pip domain-containing protein [Adlercreutzia sp. R25]MEC4271989.1 YhgE/Pip domain-containing protein [Adlercreutzia sp. R25]